MTDDFSKTLPLVDLVDEVTVGHVGSMVSEYRHNGVPFLRSTNIRPYRLDTSDLVYIGREFHARLRKSTLRPGDLVVVRTGKPGTACVIPESFGEANCSDLVIVRPGDRVDARFLAYFVNGMASGHVEAHAVGAVQQHFNIGEAKRLPVPALSVHKQRAIAEVLGALDDKIELNRQMNRTLEEMASALFKSWFVDFDPVVAKAEGRRPFGMDAETAGVFPSRMGEGIPVEWQRISLRRSGSWLSGGTPRKDEPRYWGGDIPWISAKSLKDKCVIDADARVTRLGAENGTRLAPPGSVLFVVRGMSLADEFRFGINDRPVAFNQDLKCIVPDRGVSGALIFWFLAASKADFLDAVDEASHGTKRLQTELIDRFELTLPATMATRTLLAAHFEPQIDLMFHLRRESHTLSTLRDTLLPKLLSGEVRLKQAEKAVEAAL